MCDSTSVSCSLARRDMIRRPMVGRLGVGVASSVTIPYSVTNTEAISTDRDPDSISSTKPGGSERNCRGAEPEI